MFTHAFRLYGNQLLRDYRADKQPLSCCILAEDELPAAYTMIQHSRRTAMESSDVFLSYSLGCSERDGDKTSR